jgi:TolB protein
MNRRAVLIALVVVGCGRRREASPVPPPADAGVLTRVDAAAVPPRLSVSGRVVAARHEGHVRPLLLDPATGRWSPLGGGDDHLFPTETSDGDAVLVVATHGEHEGDHVEQLAWVRGPAVERVGPPAPSIRNPSRAGAVIVFESSARSFRDLYRLDGDRADAAPVRLTDDKAGNFEPALAPAGATIVFTSSRDGDAELYRMPARGGRATRLTASARDDWGARWSPDGARLVFLSDREGPPRAFVVGADGTELHRLTAETDSTVIEDAPRWSPDGASIALLRGQATGGAVVLVDVTSQRARTLTPAGASDTEAVWSPDGAYLLVARHVPASAQGVATFVRVSDGVVIPAGDVVEPLALRWYR